MNDRCSFDCEDLVAGMTIERYGLGTLFCGEGGGRVLVEALGAFAQGGGDRWVQYGWKLNGHWKWLDG